MSDGHEAEPADSEPAVADSVAVHREREGGLLSFLVVAASFAVHFNVLGAQYGFGVFQETYEEEFEASAFAVSWVGSALTASLPMSGLIAGTIAERLGYRPTVLAGGALSVVCLVVASFATAIWQLYVFQGVLLGFASALIYFPAVSVVSHFWKRRRGLATGVAVSGAGLGGFVYATVGEWLLERYGFRTTLRLFALVFFITVAVVQSVVIEAASSQQKKEQRRSPMENFAIRTFRVLFVANVFLSLGYFVPFFFVSKFATNLGFSASFGALAIGVINGASAIGRIVLGSLGDRSGFLRLLMYCMCVASASVWFWSGADSQGTICAFAAVYGFHVGGYISLMPALMADIVGTQHLASAVGLIWTGSSFGALLGSPLAGFLIDEYEPDMKPAIWTAAACMTVGSLLIVWIYWVRGGKKEEVDVEIELGKSSSATTLT